jgi:adenylate cyclase
MGIEIERKFLVASDAWRETVDAGTDLQQGYLSVDPERVVRVRIAGVRGFLTIKGRGPTPDVRPEFEYEVPLDDAREMLALALTPPIRKTRYRLAAGALTWEIDVFGGALDGLVLAEIELPTADTPFDRPPWLGRDVTADRRYTNAVLSVEGLPADSE